MVARKTAGATAPKARRDGGKAEPPWERENPKGGAHQPLSPKQKASARRSAKAAGRPYPNLVDNMRAARSEKK